MVILFCSWRLVAVEDCIEESGTVHLVIAHVVNIFGSNKTNGFVILVVVSVAELFTPERGEGCVDLVVVSVEYVMEFALWFLSVQ